MKRKILALILALIWLPCSHAQQNFVTVKNAQFFSDGTPWYFIGANYWYGSYLVLGKNAEANKSRLIKELDFFRANGVTNLRVLAATEGNGYVNGVIRTEPPLQAQKGVFDAEQLKGLDFLLSEMGKRNMRAVLFLSNNWEWSGGFLQYLNWNGLIADSVLPRKLSWDEMRDYVSQFYSCDDCKKDYLKQVAFILDRTNSYTGKKYTDDPAIMTWELANEPRPMRPSADKAYAAWVAAAAAFIKSKDKNHLVTTGCEGLMGTENMELYQQVHADKNIDYLTIHIWPKNWGWFKDTAIHQGYDNIISNTNNYIEKHQAIAAALQKPLVVEEFGLPRDLHSFAVNSPVTQRDGYYKNIFSLIDKSAAQKGPVAGACFWAFGGTARPIQGQTFWKKGDDYMGDPPMEEQGLNSVFDNDKSTWAVINSYAKKLSGINSVAGMPVDPLATKETVQLYHNLKKTLDKGIMFGHQDDLAYGVNWKYVAGNSDIKEVTGDYPAVYGWELGRLEIDQPVNLDSVPFDKMKGYIETIYGRGGVVTISWHLNNPLTGKTAWDPATGSVASILPGGEKNELYKSWLDKVAHFLVSLKGKNGELVPVIFRPFHELNGDWFWWGGKHCTPDEFKQLWHFTVAYLRDSSNVHNLLYAYNTDQFASREAYLEKYPGDEWVDIIGFDIYQRGNGTAANETFVKNTDRMLTDLEAIASEKNKIPALTEFGYGGVPDSNWWTGTLLKALQHHKISYALGWRNAGLKPSGENEFYVPYKGQASEKDFTRFYNEGITLFQKNITKLNLYK